MQTDQELRDAFFDRMARQLGALVSQTFVSTGLELDEEDGWKTATWRAPKNGIYAIRLKIRTTLIRGSFLLATEVFRTHADGSPDVRIKYYGDHVVSIPDNWNQSNHLENIVEAPLTYAQERLPSGTYRVQGPDATPSPS